MDEQVRWVTKAEAVREMEVSVSTLDRMIRRGEIEVRREGRRVYVRMEGPEYVSDDELLRRFLVREDKLQRIVWELDGRASELERERDEARESELRPAVRRMRNCRRLTAKERCLTTGGRGDSPLRVGLVAAVLLLLLVASVLVSWLVLT